MTESTSDYRRAAVIGAGAWGTTLALLLTRRGVPVTLWAYEPAVVEAIRRKHQNVEFLPGVTLPEKLHATGSLEEAIGDADLLIFAVPSHAARSVLKRLAPLWSRPLPIVSATKGIEEETFALMSDVIHETLAGPRPTVAVLSGPSFASEVANGRPTAVVLASHDTAAAGRLQRLLMTPEFRVYTGTDLTGVQLGGALKNVVAIAAGVVDGLGLGHNARAALITRGLAEIIRLGSTLGADSRTFYGLAGMGDLVLTCTGPLSRNHAVGLRLGKGDKLTTIVSDTHTVAEGIHTARAARGLADRHGVEMPIVQEVCAVLFEGKSPSKAVAGLMERAGKAETA